MNSRGIRPYLAGLGFATIFGFSFLYTKLILEYMDPLRLLAFRFTIAALVVTALAMSSLIKLQFRGKNLWPLLGVALLQPIAYFLFETTGVDRTTTSQAGMMIALIPILVAILSTVWLKERTNKVQWLFITLSVAGVAFIALMQDINGAGGGLAGPLLLMGAVISAAFFNIASRKASSAFSPFELTFVMMWIGALVFNVLAITTHVKTQPLLTYTAVLLHPQVWIGLLYLGVLSSVVAFFLVNYSLSKIPASQAAVFANLTTLVSVVAGVVLLDEPFYWHSALGGAMILAGVWGTNYFGSGGDGSFRF